MAAESRNEPEHEPAESAIDDLIRDILAEAGQSTQNAMRGPLAAIAEVINLAPSRSTTRTSTLERLLLAEVIASAVADAVAPVLAEKLAPEILKVLEQHTPDKPPATGPVAAGEATRKPAAKQ